MHHSTILQCFITVSCVVRESLETKALLKCDVNETGPAHLLFIVPAHVAGFFFVYQHTQDSFQTKHCLSRPIDWRWLVDGHKRRQSGSLPLKFRQRNLCFPERLAAFLFCTQLKVELARSWFILLLQSWVTLPVSYRRQAQWGKGQTQTCWRPF